MIACLMMMMTMLAMMPMLMTLLDDVDGDAEDIAHAGSQPQGSSRSKPCRSTPTVSWCGQQHVARALCPAPPPFRIDVRSMCWNAPFLISARRSVNMERTAPFTPCSLNAVHSTFLQALSENAVFSTPFSLRLPLKTTVTRGQTIG